MSNRVVLLVLGLLTPVALAQEEKIVRLDPRIDALLPANAIVEKLCGDHQWTEGPVWSRQENCLLFSDIPQNAIFKWQRGTGESLYLKPSGYTGSESFTGREPGSNGLAFDATGRLVLCQHGDRRVARRETDGTFTTLADRFEGKRLNSPNDLVFRSNGDLYFTDPPYGLPKAFTDPARELDFCGVYRLSKDGKLTLLAKDIKAPNGIALAPDEKTLYVANSGKPPVWYAFDVAADGSVSNQRIFFDASEVNKGMPGGPDGLKVDAQGNLFATGPGGVLVIAPEGKLLGYIETGVPTANCAWGEDGSTLFITANRAILRVKTSTKGLGW